MHWEKSVVGKFDSLIGFGNADKSFHESWTPGRNLLNFPHPWRCLLAGPPNSGKSTAVKNILIRADPAFDRVVIVHADPDNTKEYDDIKADCPKESVIMVSEIPAPESWEYELDDNGEEIILKTLLIIDDLDCRSLNREQRKFLDRSLGYVSTHRSVSVAVCCQDMFNLPPAARRNCNIYILWRSPDLTAMQAIANKFGVKDLQRLFDDYCKSRRDSLWFDSTNGTPAPVRLNGFQVLK